MVWSAYSDFDKYHSSCHTSKEKANKKFSISDTKNQEQEI